MANELYLSAIPLGGKSWTVIHVANNSSTAIAAEVDAYRSNGKALFSPSRSVEIAAHRVAEVRVETDSALTELGWAKIHQSIGTGRGALAISVSGEKNWLYDNEVLTINQVEEQKRSNLGMWYDAASLAGKTFSISNVSPSTPAYLTICLSSSRFPFNGWLSDWVARYPTTCKATISRYIEPNNSLLYEFPSSLRGLMTIEIMGSVLAHVLNNDPGNRKRYEVKSEIKFTGEAPP